MLRTVFIIDMCGLADFGFEALVYVDMKSKLVYRRWSARGRMIVY